MYGYCCLPKSNEWVKCMIQTFFTPQNIFSQLCDHVVCNHNQHIKSAAKCDMGTQFMRGVHGYATQRVFVAILILLIFGRRTTRKNGLVEIRVHYICEWHQEINNIDALLYNRVAVTRKRDTLQWCHLTLHKILCVCWCSCCESRAGKTCERSCEHGAPKCCILVRCSKCDHFHEAFL